MNEWFHIDDLPRLESLELCESFFATDVPKRLLPLITSFFTSSVANIVDYNLMTRLRQLTCTITIDPSMPRVCFAHLRHLRVLVRCDLVPDGIRTIRYFADGAPLQRLEVFVVGYGSIQPRDNAALVRLTAALIRQGVEYITLFGACIRQGDFAPLKLYYDAWTKLTIVPPYAESKGVEEEIPDSCL